MRTAAIFGDHMVLQQGIPVPVWGRAEPGEEITVSFAGHTATGVADTDGRWLVRLPPLAASSEPRELSVSSNRKPSPAAAGGDAEGSGRRLADVLVGEVWLCSGQSNMQWSVNDAADSEREIGAANHPLLRLFTVPNVAQVEPAPDISGAWQVCRPDTIAPFSAVAYYFGRELQRKLDVPIGLVNCSWGGTRIEAWLSRATLMADPETRREVTEYEDALAHPDGLQNDYTRRLAEYAQWEKDNLPQDAGNTGHPQGWAKPGIDLADWETMPVPGYWQAQGHAYSGVFWFRRDVVIPPEHAGRDLVLNLGPIDKSDIAYFNNEEVGRVPRDTPNCWALVRAYRVPGRLVTAGRNTIAVRVLSDCWAGGFGGNPQDLTLRAPGADQPLLRLNGPWHYRIEHNFGLVVIPPAPPPPFGDGNPQSPDILSANMIRPLLPFGIRGALWYQGESNGGEGISYFHKKKALITGWRKLWN
ncbi:hypothetical protein HQ590_14260, partial [bacterium]|nr:hypothetical protein [bacterium]